MFLDPVDMLRRFDTAIRYDQSGPRVPEEGTRDNNSLIPFKG